MLVDYVLGLHSNYDIIPFLPFSSLHFSIHLVITAKYHSATTSTTISCMSASFLQAVF